MTQLHQELSDAELIGELLRLDAQRGLSLHEYPRLTEGVPFRLMTGIFSAGVNARVEKGDHLYRRVTVGISDNGTEVTVIDPLTRQRRTMLNFASNSYFGLGKHPQVIRAVSDALATYGTGPAGSPMLNGTTELHVKLEDRIARWLEKKRRWSCRQATWLMAGRRWWCGRATFSSGTKGCTPAFRRGGMKALETMRGINDRARRVVTHVFHHNNVQQLGDILRRFRKGTGCTAGNGDEVGPKASIWIAVEGVYSMDGDLAPLPEIARLAAEYQAFLVVDDAHGEGVLGGGRGIEHHFAEPAPTFLTVGTLGKAFASGGGGFIAGPGM